MLGLLVSPNRGALIFSPFLLFCIYGAGVGLRQAGTPLPNVLALALVVGLISAPPSHGFLASLARNPLLWIPLLDRRPALPGRCCGGFAIDRVLSRGLWRRMFATTVVVSILIHSLAVYWDDPSAGTRSDPPMREHLKIRDFEDAAWVADDPQILWQARFALGLTDED